MNYTGNVKPKISLQQIAAKPSKRWYDRFMLPKYKRKRLDFIARDAKKAGNRVKTIDYKNNKVILEINNGS